MTPLFELALCWAKVQKSRTSNRWTAFSNFWFL